MRLIDKDALMQSLGITDMDCDKCAWADKEWSRCKRGGDFEDACYAIENAPTIEERKKAEWNYYYRKTTKDTFVCNGCGACFVVMQGADKMNYCPNCGAKQI